jgi:hypothetical protein
MEIYVSDLHLQKQVKEDLRVKKAHGESQGTQLCKYLIFLPIRS